MLEKSIATRVAGVGVPIGKPGTVTMNELCTFCALVLEKNKLYGAEKLKTSVNISTLVKENTPLSCRRRMAPSPTPIPGAEIARVPLAVEMKNVCGNESGDGTVVKR